MAKIELAYQTNEEALAAWDDNRPVWTCTMGGLGPGYEQCIHMMAFEMLRSMLVHPCPPPLEENLSEEEKKAHQKLWKDYSDLIEATPNVKAVMKQVQPTGAQFGAAMNIASVYAINGYAKGVEMIPDDRAITVQKESAAFTKAT